MTVNNYFTLRHDDVNGGVAVQYIAIFSAQPVVSGRVSPRRLSRNVLGKVLLTISNSSQKTFALTIRVDPTQFAFLNEFLQKGLVEFQHWDDSQAPYDVLIVNSSLDPIALEPFAEIQNVTIEMIENDNS